MPDEPKPPLTPPQAGSNWDKFLEEFRRANLDKQLREGPSRSDLDKFREEFRRSELNKQPREEPSRANLDKPCAQPNNSNLDKSREEPSDADNKSEQAPSAKPKPKQRRVKIPHANEAIDLMLAVRRTDPDKFYFHKECVGRVIDILKKQYGVTVSDSQIKTLGRWIVERIALSGQT